MSDRPTTESRRVLINVLLIAVGLVVGVVAGATGAYVALHPRNYRSLDLKREGSGLAWTNDAIFVDLPLPDTTAPKGQAKFVDRGTGRGTELGYLVKTKMDKLDTSKIPEKYKQVEKHGDYTIGPIGTTRSLRPLPSRMVTMPFFVSTSWSFKFRSSARRIPVE